MSCNDRVPLGDGPAAERIQLYANNRLGAVYSALYSFWTARHATIAAGQQSGSRRGYNSVYSALYSALWSTSSTAGAADQQAGGGRRDAYSVILFNESSKTVLTNDFTRTPDQLLDVLLNEDASGGTNFATALSAGQSVMIQHWSTERLPVMIFLSDGECGVSDLAIEDVCRAAIQIGKPLSFHAVFFGTDASQPTLRRMADLALNLQNNAPRPVTATVPSSFSTALNTVRLTETFLGIAESLRKPRGSLMH